MAKRSAFAKMIHAIIHACDNPRIWMLGIYYRLTTDPEEDIDESRI